MLRKHQQKVCLIVDVIFKKVNFLFAGCLMVVSGCNKGSFGGGDDSPATVKTKVEIQRIAEATQAEDGRGAIVIKAGNKLTAECVGCELKFTESKDDRGLFVYTAPFSYKLAGKLAEGKTLQCTLEIKVSKSKNENDNKKRDLGILFCPKKGEGRECDTANMVQECPIL